MSTVELAVEKVKKLSESQAQALLEWLRTQPPHQGAASQPRAPLEKEPLWMKDFGAFGQTPETRAETRRIQKLIDDEFESLEPEETR
ncbi:MAG: hypothetical protein FJ398_09610 [Verrucomicrobia bacterium]|nr:hypothetical protein [Verrucomicrobiota bacterium]